MSNLEFGQVCAYPCANCGHCSRLSKVCWADIMLLMVSSSWCMLNDRWSWHKNLCRPIQATIVEQLALNKSDRWFITSKSVGVAATFLQNWDAVCGSAGHVWPWPHGSWPIICLFQVVITLTLRASLRTAMSLAKEQIKDLLRNQEPVLGSYITESCCCVANVKGQFCEKFSRKGAFLEASFYLRTAAAVIVVATVVFLM